MVMTFFFYHYYYFSQKIRHDISCKLSPVETVCMKYQALFFWLEDAGLLGGEEGGWGRVEN